MIGYNFLLLYYESDGKVDILNNMHLQMYKP